MTYKDWKRIKTVEKEYLNTLLKLVKIFKKIANSSGNDQQKYIDSMNNFQNSMQYEKFINSAVKRMVLPLDVGNQRTWREAAKKATKSKFLYRLLMDELKQGTGQIIHKQVIENVLLIKTLPNDVAQKVVSDISENALKGARAESTEKIIRDKTDQHARASARLIARTETAKTMSALTKARCEQLGLRWYIWRTALDGTRVRLSHRIMEGVLVNWNNPPAPEELVGEKSVGHYHAGNIWNCRCFSEPVLELEDIRFPARVYYNGQIVMMNKSEFEQIM